MSCENIDNALEKIFNKTNIFYRIKRSIRFFFQRIFRGWTDEDTWSLDMTISSFIVPRLKRFKEKTNGYPGNFTEKTWNEALDKMIFAFERCSKRFEKEQEWDQELLDKVNEGLKLFSENFHELWW